MYWPVSSKYLSYAEFLLAYIIIFFKYRFISSDSRDEERI